MVARYVLGVLRMTRIPSTARVLEGVALLGILASGRAAFSEAATDATSATTTPQAVPAFVEKLAEDQGITHYLGSGLLLIVAISALVIFYAAFRIIRHLQEMRAAEELQEAQFESSVIAALMAGDRDIGELPATNHDYDQTIPSISSSAAGAKIISVGESGPAQPAADVACRAVMDQLRRSGLLEAVEGYVTLNGNPKGGAILLLRNRKRVLLVPYYESEIFTERELQRCDALLYVSRSGKAVYIQSLESVIAETFK